MESRDWEVGPGILLKPGHTPQFLTLIFPQVDVLTSFDRVRPMTLFSDHRLSRAMDAEVGSYLRSPSRSTMVR